jgi:hypothetical protein
MIRFGIAGHRSLDDRNVSEFVARQLESILRDARKQNIGTTAISAVAEGADTIFAETALSLNVPLEIVKPFRGYSNDFKTTHSRSRYRNLLRRAAREITMPFNERSDVAYQTAMHWIVDNCDVLIAVWNGERSDRIGGTVDAVERAIRSKRKWIHLNVNELTVNFHFIV